MAYVVPGKGGSGQNYPSRSPKKKKSGNNIFDSIANAADNVSWNVNSGGVQDIDKITKNKWKENKKKNKKPRKKVKRGPSYTAGPDPFDTLLQQMIGRVNNQDYDASDVLKSTSKAIKKSYRSEIQAIKNDNELAAKQTRKGRKELEHMYGVLAQNFGATAKRANKAGKTSAKQMRNLAKGNNRTLTKSQNALTRQQGKLLKNLGFEDSAKEILSPQLNDLAATRRQNTREGGEDARRERAFGKVQARYFKRGKAGAKFEGANASAALLGDLQDYLQGNQNNIQKLRSQRSVDLAQNRGEVMRGVAEQQAQQSENLWDMVMEYQNYKMDQQDTQFDNNLAQQKLMAEIQQNQAKNSQGSIPDYLYNPAKIVSSQAKNKHQASNIQSVLKSLQASTPFTSNKTKYGDSTASLTPFYAMKMAESEGKKRGLSRYAIEILKQAAAASVD